MVTMISPVIVLTHLLREPLLLVLVGGALSVVEVATTTYHASLTMAMQAKMLELMKL